tara:strand:+ start:426 stop:1550 length:1125 start_codon:yes stop_codon:yes gene_type:complete
MSTAYYPQGMRRRMSYGNPGQYITWKGRGILSNPVGSTTSHRRPLTNNDSGNVFLSGSFPNRTFGKGRVFIPRPLKHYRKGRAIPAPIIEPRDPTDPENVHEVKLINYNLHRDVYSSRGQSISGGGGLLGDMIDKPGSYIVKENTADENNTSSDNTCGGVCIVASYSPNNVYLTENPEPKTQTRVFCCNEEYKARKRVVYANTNLKKNYYTTTKSYLQNRCNTFEQKSFNFQTKSDFPLAKPGSALATDNTYFANCYPYVGPNENGPSNPIGCKLTVYKPNNPQFAKQGAVSSSTRLLKLNVDTISTNAKKYDIPLVTANELNKGVDNNVSNIYKNKASKTCPDALISGVYRYQNKKICSAYRYQNPIILTTQL